MLTKRIRDLTEHLKQHKRTSIRNGSFEMVGTSGSFSGILGQRLQPLQRLIERLELRH
jgi:hypothetical protein